MGAVDRQVRALGLVLLCVTDGWCALPQTSAATDPAVGTTETSASFVQFQMHVVPVLERRCNGCHGLLKEQYETFEVEPDNRVLLRWIVDESGRIGAPETQQLAFERSTVTRQAESRSLQPLDYSGPALASPFVRAPLSRRHSGYAGHPEVFASTDDPDWQTIRDWAELEVESRPNVSEPLSEVESFFAEKVTPILARKTCFGTNCHGKLAFSDLKLDPGIPALEARFTPSLYRSNRQAMLGTVTRLVHLSGDVSQSKQLLKNIPVEQGGIVHKGGNTFFEKGDPDYQVILKWLEMEAAEARKRSGYPLGKVGGTVFVRRPNDTPERFFEADTFLPGGDLYLRTGDTELNLTASLHPDGPADVRAPDVRFDGKCVVFAMRLSEQTPFNLWELDIESGLARQLTYSTDPGIHYLDALYVPDPADASGDHLDRACLVLVSNVAGGVCESGPAHILGEAEDGTTNAIYDAQRTEKNDTFDGRVLRIVRGTNIGETRRIQRYEVGRIYVDRAFEKPCDSTTHYTIELDARRTNRYDAYRLGVAPRGREREYFDERLVRMTYSVGQLRRPTLRSSGEIIFTTLRTGWQDGRPYFNGALYRTHIDGSNFHPHNGNRSGVPIHGDDRELPNGLEIRIGRDADSWWGGALLLSDHQFGPTIENDNPRDNLDHPYSDGPPKHAEHRFVPGWIPLDPNVTCSGVSPGGAYRDPYPMPDGSVLVAYAPGPIDLCDAEAAPDFDIVRLVPNPAFQSVDGYAHGPYTREGAIGGPESELWPRPVYPRLKEPAKKTLKAETSLLGNPIHADGYVAYPASTPAALQIYDALLLDAFFEQTTPVGARHIAADICPSCSEETNAADRVRFVRVIGTELQTATSGPAPRQFMIAEAPVEPDGSFYAAIPSGISFDIQSLNEDRMALRSPHRWLYCLPGEKHTLSIPRALYPQTCSGCHGGLSGRPEDTLRHPDAVTSASRTMAAWGANGKRLPNNWSDAMTVQTGRTYPAPALLQLIERRCLPCHSNESPGGDLILSDGHALENLRRFVAQPDTLAIKSYLVEKLMGSELRAARAIEGESPHPLTSPLSGDEMLTVIRWIDLGAGD